jgi:hypothetical protein
MSMPATHPVLEAFHPAVRTWFERKFPEGPTEPQAAGWPAIARNVDTLIAAPTGSGKTLSAFMVCIDRLYREAEGFRLGEADRDGTQVVYVSPLKALGVDIKKNLDEPLAEIATIAKELGSAAPDIRVGVRSGDTPASQRASMLKRPPQLLITTPESLYLMITAERSREILRGVHTVIVDEIHAVARDKRGSHLALSLERLAALCDTRPTRIGLSATQRPIETISRLLVGAGAERSNADKTARWRPQGVGRNSVAGIGHRYRSGRSRLSDRLSSRDWNVLAACRAFWAFTRWNAQGSPLSDDARRACRMCRAASRRRRGPTRRDLASRRTDRHPGSAHCRCLWRRRVEGRRAL